VAHLPIWNGSAVVGFGERGKAADRQETAVCATDSRSRTSLHLNHPGCNALNPTSNLAEVCGVERASLAHYNLARACHLLGQMDEAEALCRRALEMDGEHAEAHNNLGKVWGAQGDLELAIRNLKSDQCRPQALDCAAQFGKSA
jgi:tetratricopeptide (TPR) repeat protein